ncbi:MAG TPA: P-loop NTPase [Caldisericia bacterium]|nr:P-loop NTPase [Caldisericia bacterium]HPF48602.1 P-loop NTPase [Caldisericia bacterium]HPI83738.1 P-loop NTPase [Caldisericia bacterium]HPQ93057.1 P-loop NTPase [Caldisericia bacterium]HRV75110.1 P-loop NTPase [Caldisericia bacterium]
MIDKEVVMKALATVMDPELGADLVTLGMIDAVDINDKNVLVTVALTVAGCPMKNTIGKDVVEAVSKIEGISKVETKFVAMTDEQKQKTFAIAQKVRAGGNAASQDSADPLQKLSGKNIKNIIAIGSGKGGVGKSTITAMIAVEARKKGYKVGVLDADITGPSIPTLFGQTGLLTAAKDGVTPRTTKSGIKLVSMNLLMKDPSLPVIWRGPILSGVIKQFYNDVDWGELDYLFLDLPPGTGDMPLTVFQAYPLNGLVVVTSPQQLANLVVTKSIKMASEMNIPLVGIVENMTHLICPDCGSEIAVFGKSQVEERCKSQGVPYLGGVPIEPIIAESADRGLIENVDIPGAIENVFAIIDGKQKN